MVKAERIEEVAGKDCVGLVGRLEASGFYSGTESQKPRLLLAGQGAKGVWSRALSRSDVGYNVISLAVVENRF